MRTKKAFKNMVAALIYQVIAIVCGLITPRLILARFGSTYNGVINSATQFLSMINLLTLGITGATRVALYKTLGNKDTLGTSRIMKATKQYMRKVGLCVIVYASVLCVVYPFISHNDLSHSQNAAIIAIVSIGTFAQYFFGISNMTLIQADQSSYITYSLDIFKTVVNTFFVALIIHWGGTIYEVKLGSALVFLVTPIIMEIYVKRKYGLINDCEPDYSGMEQRGAVAFLSIANMVHNNVDIVLLTMFTDAKNISVYTVYYLVIGKIKSLMTIVTSGMEAAFGNMWTKKEYETLQKNFRGFEFVMFSFTAVVFSCVGVLIIPFITRYTRGINDVKYASLELAVLITAAEALHCVRQPYMTLVQATGRYKETKNGSAIEALLNLVVSLVLVIFMGIPGVIIGTLVANAFRTTQYALYISKKILNRSIIEVVHRFIWTCICIALSVTLSLFVIRNITFDEGWIGWLYEAVITFTVSCVGWLIMSICFYRQEFTLIISLMMRMLKTGRK